jgi:hypothetical protein
MVSPVGDHPDLDSSELEHMGVWFGVSAGIPD